MVSSSLFESAITGTLLVLEPPRHCGLSPILLVPGRHLIGTDPTCAIGLHAEGIAERHALVVAGENRTVLKAIDPRTWVNEGPVSDVALRSGDRLSIGPLTFRVRSATRDERQSAASLEAHRTDDADWDATAGLDTLPEPVVQDPPAPSVRAVAHAETNPTTPRARDTADPTREADEAQQQTVEVIPTSTAQTTRAVADSETLPTSLKTPPGECPDTQPHPASLAASVSVRSAERVPSEATATTPVSADPKPPVSADPKPPVSADPKHRPLAPSRGEDALGWRLEEIHHRLAELRQTTDRISRPLPRTERTESDERHPLHQLQARHDELQRRAEQLAAESLALQERARQIQERETRLEAHQIQLREEAARIASVAQSARQTLAEEHSRHVAVWQEWEASYQRMTVDLAEKLDAMERQREILHGEAERLASTREELEQNRAELERGQAELATRKVELDRESETLSRQRTEWEAEQRRRRQDADETALQLDQERQNLDRLRAELIAEQQELGRERQTLMADWSSHVKRIEVENQRRAALQAQQEDDRQRLAEERAALSNLAARLAHDRVQLDQQAARLESAQRSAEHAAQDAEMLTARIQAVEEELVQVRMQRDRERAAATAQRDEELRVQTELQARLAEDRRLLEGQRTELVALRERLEQERQDLATACVPRDLTAKDAADHENASPSSAVQVLMSSQPCELPVVPVAEAVQFVSERTALPDSGRADPGQPEATAETWDPASGTMNYDPGPVASWPVISPGITVEPETVWSRGDVDSGRPPVPPPLPDPLLTAACSTAPSRDSDRSSAHFHEVACDPWSIPADGVQHDCQEAGHHPDSPGSSWQVDPAPTTTLVLGTNASAAPGTPPLSDASGSPESAVPADREACTPDATLAEVTREFGTPATEAATSSTPLPAWWVESPEPPETPVAEQPGWVAEVLRAAPAEATPSDESGDGLRSQLARLFDIPAESLRHAQENPSSGEFPAAADGPAEASVAVAVSTAEAAGDKGRPEDSVEIFMARLLARSRGEEVSESAVTPVPVTTPSIPSTPSSELTPEAVAADRSHLMAEPKHKQDKQAVRENLLSFREVAQLSARSALARHSLEQLRNATIAKGVLLGCSALATLAFGIEPLWTGQLQLWKGIACSLATLLSAIEFRRSWNQWYRPPQTLTTATGDGQSTAEPQAEPVSPEQVPEQSGSAATGRNASREVNPDPAAEPASAG